VISSSPEKAGRSSKSKVKSPCSPHAVGDADADAEVLLDVVVVLPEDEVDRTLGDGLEAWLVAENEPVGEVACELCVIELISDDVGVAGPFAKELPMEVKAWVLGMTEVRLALKAIEELEAVMLPVVDTATGLSVEFEEASVVTPVLVLDSRLDVLVAAASASEAPVLEGTVVLASRLDVDAVKVAETIEEAF